MSFWKISPRPVPSHRGWLASWRARPRSSRRATRRRLAGRTGSRGAGPRRAGADQGEAAVMEGVDQLLRRWRSLDEDAEPPKGIGSGVLRARVLRSRSCRPRKSRRSRRRSRRRSPLAGHSEGSESSAIQCPGFYAFGPGFEQDLSVRFEPGADQVLDDFLLAVDGDRKPVRQVGEVDAVPASVEAKFDPVVDGTFQHPPRRRPPRAVRPCRVRARRP